MSGSKTVNSVLRAARILQSIAGGNSRIAKISESLELSNGTTHRLLGTLEKVGFVVKDRQSHEYHLGPSLLELVSNPISSHETLIVCAYEQMAYLRELTQETVLLDIRSGLQKVCVEKIDSPKQLKYTNEKGFASPLYVGCGGKALLSQMSDSEIRLVFEHTNFVSFTPHTITDTDKLWRVIEVVREQGYATGFGERVPGSSCVSVPVRNYYTPVALSILGPDTRFTLEQIIEIVDRLKQAGQIISEKLRRLKESVIGHGQ